MEVTALCCSLLLNVLLLQTELVPFGYAQRGKDVFLHIVPDKQQFFQYESISFTCEGFNGSARLRGKRNTEEFTPTCSQSSLNSTVTCNIDNAYVEDSGEYWCEAEGGQRSNGVNITVTAASVTLESPVLPVTEGDAVTLRCRTKSSSNLIADFYKNGLHIWTTISGSWTIHDVSKSDEGLYRCKISGAGDSAESRLAVIESALSEQNQEGCSAGSVILESPALPVMEGDTVTLRCRNNSSSTGNGTSSTNLQAVFFKDGVFIGSSSTGRMTISYVYKSHEGLYRCNISGAGQSQGSWLAVRALHRETWALSDTFIQVFLILRTVFTMLMVVLLLLLLRLLHCGKLTAHKD